MHYTGTVWRPPYEAWSALIQVTMGCTHHKCKFCTLYEDLPFKFKMSPQSEVESGDDNALQFMNKGYISSDIIKQCKRLENAGIEYNIFYLTGISGEGSGIKGAEISAEVFNRLNPKIIGCSMLTVYKNSELYSEIQNGNWHEESETEKIAELKTLINALTIKTHFAALGASNMINIQGSLPADKNELTEALDKLLSSFSEEEMKSYRDNLPHL